MEISIMIKKMRKKRGWTQADLAKKINVSSQVISNWERNYTHPNSQDCKRLAVIFDVSLDLLLGKDTNDEITPTDIEMELYENIHLDDDALLEHFKFHVDGRPATKEEIQEVIDYVRAKRIMNDQKAKKNI